MHSVDEEAFLWGFILFMCTMKTTLIISKKISLRITWHIFFLVSFEIIKHNPNQNKKIYTDIAPITHVRNKNSNIQREVTEYGKSYLP